MGVVDYEYYSTVYMGTDADEASFPALCARASDIIGAVTHWADEDTVANLPPVYRTLYKKALCAQIDFLAICNIAAKYGPFIGKTVGFSLKGADGVFGFQLPHNTFTDDTVIGNLHRFLQVDLPIAAAAAGQQQGQQ
jgi:hypothetical protein